MRALLIFLSLRLIWSSFGGFAEPPGQDKHDNVLTKQLALSLGQAPLAFFSRRLIWSSSADFAEPRGMLEILAKPLLYFHWDKLCWLFLASGSGGLA